MNHLNKYSNNLMTRNLFLTLGAEQRGAPATLEKSSQAVHAWLAEQQIAAPELVLENGAGLSRLERISAATLSQMLLAAYHSPVFSEFESALPILAVDGTLRRRFIDSPLAGRSHKLPPGPNTHEKSGLAPRWDCELPRGVECRSWRDQLQERK